jgi:uncharacterized membrane protein required for colicin V production
MEIITIFAVLILVFSFIGGYSQGLAKSFFSLIAVIVAIPVAGRYYSFFAGFLGFINNRDWENFIGFFITSAIVSIILSIIFYFPRKIMEKTWHEGFAFRVVGGLLNLLGAVIGLVVLTTIVSAFPVWEWLRFHLSDSSLINWLMENFTFVQSLLPEVLRFPHIPLS